MIATFFAGLWLLVITALSFAFWLRPGLFAALIPARGDSAALYQAISVVLAVLFFLSYFALGCWLSLLQVVGIW